MHHHQNVHTYHHLTMKIQKMFLIKKKEKIASKTFMLSEVRKGKGYWRRNHLRLTLSVFNWKDVQMRSFFKKYTFNETKYKKAEGRMKKYGKGKKIARDVGDELTENGEAFWLDLIVV